jgi:hypothetical protein
LPPPETIPILPVFLSSTWVDLEPERQAIDEALQAIRHTKLVGMESFGSRSEDTRQASLDEVDRSTVYVGVFGGRYGSGITEAEYRRARERRLPCFIYFKDEATIPPDGRERDPERTERLEQLKRELRQAHTISPPFRTPHQLAARVAVDLFNWFLDRHPERAKGPFLEGISRLPTQYEERIQSFLDLYLGTSEEPVPFGGRDAALAALDAWLEDSAACPYLLVTAGAGRGKSALLVRWTRSLLMRSDLATVFFPVSIRFRTNLLGVLLPSLVARLSALRGEEVPWSPKMSVEEWRGVLADLLARPLPDGRRLLVVLDGLDESAEESLAAPDLFPLSPRESLRVVVSARRTVGDKDGSAWLNRLGWKRGSLAEVMDLLPLDRPGVAQVLERMGLPLDKLASDIPVVDQLFRLTEGDPLLVGLYVEDLWGRGEEAARLRPEDLARIPPGLEGFFERWWEDQRLLWGDKAPLREREVRTVLALLATAQGPLPRQDLRRLALPDVQLDTFLLTEQVLPPLRRFVTGDGQQQGYVFSHPRLGQHVYGKMDSDERQDWERRFLTWGEETLTRLERGEVQPDEVSPYLVQYLGAHLERAGAAPEKLLALVSDGWRQSWERLEGTYSGFLNDVARARRSAARANGNALARGHLAPFLSGEVLAALVSASVNSLAGNFGPSLLESLVRGQVWTPLQALVHARQITEPTQRAEALAALAPHLPAGESTAVLAEALKAARAGGNWDRIHVLRRAAPHLGEALVSEALSLAGTIDTYYPYVEGVFTILSCLPPERLREVLASNGQSSITLAIAQARLGLQEAADLAEPERRSWLQGALSTALQLLREHPAGSSLLADILALLPEKDRLPPLQEAFDLLREHDIQLIRFESLVILAPVFPEPERLMAFREVLAAAEEAIGNQFERAKRLARIARIVPEELLGELSTAVARISIAARALAIAELARRKPPSEREPSLDATWEEVKKELTYEPDIAQSLAALALAYSEPRRSAALREALAAAKAIPSDDLRADAIARLSPSLPPPLLREALAAVRYLGDLNWRAQTLAHLAIRFPAELREKPVRSLLAGMRELKDPGFYLRVLAPHLPDAMKEDALALALAIPEESGRGEALHGLGPCLSPALAERALPHARSLTTPRHRANAVAALLPWLGDEERRTVREETLAVIRATGEPDDRALALVPLAPHLAPEEREREIREVLRFASNTGTEKTLLNTVYHLAPALSEPLIGEILEGDEWRWARYDDLGDVRVELVSRLAELGRAEKAFAQALELSSPSKQDQALQRVARWLPLPLVPRMLSHVEGKDSGWSRRYLLGALAPLLQGDDFVRAWALARDIQPRLPEVEALIALIGNAPPERLGDLLRDVLEELRQIDDDTFNRNPGPQLRGRNLAELLSRVGERLPPSELYPLFHEMLDELGRGDRQPLLYGLMMAAPALLRIGGTAALAESFQAIEQVGRWWP